jgi:hypothetical protein
MNKDTIDLKDSVLSKEEYLIYKIKEHYPTKSKIRKFLIVNIKDFSNFIEMNPYDLYDYSTFNFYGLKLLIDNGQDVNVLKTIEDFGHFLNRKFEEYCIHLALSKLEEEK